VLHDRYLCVVKYLQKQRLSDIEKSLLLRQKLLSFAFRKNIPGDRKEFPALLEAAAARGVTMSVLPLTPLEPSL
jgi:hypothetical protein